MEFAESLARIVREHGYVLDEGQQHVAARLGALDDDWRRYKFARRNAFLRIISHPGIPRGIYIWGGVGRGKSFLMDAFYAASPLVRKTRLHFHEFMRSVHRELDAVRGTAEPLDEVAHRIARRHRLICFDEFHVSDIADAMILYRLLAKLMEFGVGFVMTSNYAPDSLYPDGLHRDRFLPAIELLKERLDVVTPGSGRDWRTMTLARDEVYRVPDGEEADRGFAALFEQLAQGPDEEPLLRIEARTIPCRRRAGSVAWFDFAVLCGGPRSQNDYLEIASRFDTVVLSNVPQMSAGQSSEARRFTWLVDVFYDHRIKLLLSAAAPPTQLYMAGVLASEFARTASRLIEMQSRSYLEAPRRAVADA